MYYSGCYKCFWGHVFKFLSVVDFVAPIKTLRVKTNTKPWFDTDVLNAIQNCVQHQKNLNDQARKLTKAVLKIINNKNFSLKKKLHKIIKILKNSGKF